MDNKELIRKSLMGDKQAQEKCTAKGIVLPCPFCGEELRERKTRKWTATKDEPINRTIVEHKAKTGCYLDNWVMEKEIELESWNTRPAPLLGRCRECKCWQRNGSDWGNCSKWYTEDKVQAFMLEDDFCSNFEPREESR